MRTVLASVLREAPFCPPLFSAPIVGRQILAGFSCLHRMGGTTQTRLWLPRSVLPHRIAWAAIREFELVHEVDPDDAVELDTADANDGFESWLYRRAGGYRLTMLSLGVYTGPDAPDDLYVLDHRLQDEIAHLIPYLYLSEPSQKASLRAATQLKNGTWRYEENLPHVALALEAKTLFATDRRRCAEQAFFEILNRLPHNHILHDVAVGLALPVLDERETWSSVIDGEFRPLAFFNAIGATMGESIPAYAPSAWGTAHGAHKLTPFQPL